EALLVKDTTKGIHSDIGNMIQKNHVKNASTTLAAHRENAGAIGAIFNKTDWAIREVWQGKVEQWFALPLSRQYLMFANYGPFNVIETYLRSALADQGIFFHALRDTDYVEHARLLMAGTTPGLTPSMLDVAVYQPQQSAVGSSGRALYEQVGKIPGITRPVPKALTLGRVLAVPNFLVKPLNNLLGKYQLRKIPQWRYMQEANVSMGNLSRQIEAATYLNRYYRNLKVLHPNEYAKMNGAIPYHMLDNVGTIRTKDLDALKTEVHNLLVTLGPDGVRGLVPELGTLQHKIFVKNLGMELDKLTEVDESVRMYVLDAIQSGRMKSETLSEVIADAKEMYMSTSIAKIIEHTNQLSSYFEQAYKVAPRSAEEMEAELFTAANLFYDLIPRSVEDAQETLVKLGHRIVNPSQTGKMYDSHRIFMEQYLDQAEKRLIQVEDWARASMKILPEQRRGLVTAQLKNMRQRFDDLFETRRKSWAIIDDFIATNPKRDRDSWRAALRQAERPWDEFSERDFQYRIIDSQLSAQQSGVTIPKPPMVRGELRRDHLAQLFNNTDNNIERQLLFGQMTTIVGRKRFRNLVRAQAELVGSQAERSADEMGFTAEAVEKLYDELMATMRLGKDNQWALG
ncbi:hypothetical protein LCGC14_2199450, partial [marine sediment metagenome]